MSVASVAIQFTLIDALSKGVDAIKSRMKGLAQANREVQQSFDHMARSAKYAAIAGLATREIYRGLKPAVGAAAGLQAEMLGARAELAGAVKDSRALAEQLKQIKSTAFEVQAWTPFDQAQIVALEKELIKAGGRIEAVVGRQGAAAAAAALGTYEGLDPVQMGQNLIGIATPFKLQADGFMALADEISRASSASTVGVAEIAETAKYAAPAMATLGRSTHEMLVLSAVLAQNGLEASMAGTGLRQFFNAAAKQKVFRDAAGNLKPLNEMLEILRKRLDGLGEAQKLDLLTRVFDVRGAPVAMALLDQGAASFDAIERSMAEALPLQEKIQVQMQGVGKQWEALKGTSRSTLAELYQPALAPLTALLKGTNALMEMLGTASQHSDVLGLATSGVSLGALAAGGAATLGLGGAALWYGSKMLKGVGGIRGLLGSAGSTAAGIATGKAVEVATGVQPVFVTNWPESFGSGAAANLAASAAGGGMLGRMAQWGGGLKARLAGLASAATATVGGQAALALAAGYGMGWGIDRAGGAMRGKEHLLDDTGLGDAIGAFLNRVAAPFSEQSRQAIEINMQIDQAGRAFVEADDVPVRSRVSLGRGEF